MTSLISWIGVDDRGPASLYVAADSRITWFDGLQWDHGRKVFASKCFPEMFGYCGEAFFPTHVLSQVVETIDIGLLLDVGQQSFEKLERLKAIIERSLSNYPSRSQFRFDLLYCTRQGEGMRSVFKVFQLSFQRDQLQSINELPLPHKSGHVAILGSGTNAVESSLKMWQDKDLKGTSRAIFAAFCDATSSGNDPKTGGIPQLAVIHRIGGAQICGFVNGNTRGICGVELAPPESAGGIAWFNNLFEICDGTSGQRRPGAQPQPRPKHV